MKHSQTITKIALAMVAVQGAVGVADKSSVNPHFKNRYADLVSVWNACRAALQAAGVAVIQMPESEDGERITVRTMLLHTSGEFIESSLTLKPSKCDPQGAGSVITYAKRYALCAMVGVVADDDDDGNAASTPPQQSQRQVPKVTQTAAKPGALVEIQAALKSWSGMIGADLTSATNTVKVKAGCLDSDTSAEKMDKVRAFIEANKSRDFLEAIK